MARKKINIKKESIDKILEKEGALVNPIINKMLVSGVDKKFWGPVKYQVSTGGKRLRPVLAIISCLLLGGKLKDVLYPAAALEILHNYTLIIDDIIDNSKTRRNKPTTWYKFGKTTAYCVAVDYSASIFQRLGRYFQKSEILNILIKTIKKIVDGEILDILFEQENKEREIYINKNRYKLISKNDYFKMIRDKTAVLIESCCQIGGICAKATTKQINALQKYGYNLGMAFQIQDDILDIFGNNKFGKKIGKDIEERKRGNIVILLALNELSKKDKTKLLNIFKKNKITQQDIKKVIKFIKQTNSWQEAQQLGKHYINKSKENLKILPQNKWNKALEEIADLAIERNK